MSKHHHTVDMEALSQKRSSPALNLFIQSQINRPGFDVKKICQRCEAWNSTQPLHTKPERPFANSDFDSCSGCAFSYCQAPEKPTDHASKKQNKRKPKTLLLRLM